MNTVDIKKELSKEIGLRCKQFRAEVLKIPMKDFAHEVGETVPNINAFERGGANSVHYLFYYYEKATPLAQDYFKDIIFKAKQQVKEGK